MISLKILPVCLLAVGLLGCGRTPRSAPEAVSPIEQPKPITRTEPKKLSSLRRLNEFILGNGLADLRISFLWPDVARLNARQGDFAAVEQLLGELARQGPHHALALIIEEEIRAVLAEGLAKQGEWAAALQALDQIPTGSLTWRCTALAAIACEYDRHARRKDADLLWEQAEHILASESTAAYQSGLELAILSKYLECERIDDARRIAESRQRRTGDKTPSVP